MMSDQHRKNENGGADDSCPLVVASSPQEMVILKIAVIGLIVFSILIVLIVPPNNLFPLISIMWVGLVVAFFVTYFIARKSSNGIIYTILKSKIIINRKDSHKVISANHITRIRCYKSAIVLQYKEGHSKKEISLFLGKEVKAVATFISREWGMVIR